MQLARWKIFGGIGLLATLVAVACSPSGSSSASMPTGPSSFGTPGGGTTIMGTTRAPGTTASATGFSLQGVTTIRVCIAGTAVCTDVDGTGNFELTGDFSGDVQLQVTGSEGTVTFTIHGVKHGETIVVSIELNGASGSAQVVSRHGGDDDSDDTSVDDPVDDDSVDDDSVDDDSVDDDSDGESADDDSSGSPGSPGPVPPAA